MIKKLNINLLEKLSMERYNKERLAYIADFETPESGWFGLSFKPDPVAGEAVWNKNFPEGYDDWINKRGDELTVYGTQEVLNKIDELVDFINKNFPGENTEKS